MEKTRFKAGFFYTSSDQALARFAKFVQWALVVGNRELTRLNQVVA